MKLTILFALLSPTWAFACFLKGKASEKEKKKIIITRLNSFYLILAISSTIIVAIYQYLIRTESLISLYNSLHIVGVILWSYFLLSRSNEIFGAFLNDAFDKMDNGNEGSSSLTPRERIVLSLKSYLELLLDFALLYAITDASLWKGCIAPLKITDAIYYSGITITTTGYGDITPINWYPQFLAVYEVFCGVILLVVCFAIYAARLGLTPHSTTE
ncbi:MAG: potassium channel family protein [Methylobacter sp.]